LQALGGGDAALCAQLYAWQADAYMGLAARAAAGTRHQTSIVSKAENYVDKAGDCECTIQQLIRRGGLYLTRLIPAVDFRKIGDSNGECNMLAKKSLVARIRGDESLAEDWATKYVTLNKKLCNQGYETGIVSA
jgi:anaphase-promoting complex subunit 5